MSDVTKDYNCNEHQAMTAAAENALAEAVRHLTKGRTNLCIAFHANRKLGRQSTADKIQRSADEIDRIVRILQPMTDW